MAYGVITRVSTLVAAILFCYVFVGLSSVGLNESRCVWRCNGRHLFLIFFIMWPDNVIATVVFVFVVVLTRRRRSESPNRSASLACFAELGDKVYLGVSVVNGSDDQQR